MKQISLAPLEWAGKIFPLDAFRYGHLFSQFRKLQELRPSTTFWYQRVHFNSQLWPPFVSQVVTESVSRLELTEMVACFY